MNEEEIENGCKGGSGTSLMGYSKDLFKKYDYTCVYCENYFGDSFENWMRLTREHVIPVSRLIGDEVKEIMDATGESLGGIIIDSEADLSAEINYKIRYLRERPPVNRLRKVIEYISKKYEKSNQRKKVKYKNKKVIMETETGYYSLINPTLLNDPIYYDDYSTDDIYNRVFDHLVASFSKKQKEIKKAIELSKKEDKMSGKQEQLDNYD